MNRSACRLCGAEHNGPFQGCPGERPKQVVSSNSMLAWHGQGQPKNPYDIAKAAESWRKRYDEFLKPRLNVTTKLKERIEAHDIQVEDAFVQLVQIVDHLGELLHGSKPSTTMRRAIAEAVLALDEEAR